MRAFVTILTYIFLFEVVVSQLLSSTTSLRHDDVPNTKDVTTIVSHGVSYACSQGYQSGKAGAIAGLIQVLTLMWLRTVVNYQYRYELTMKEAIRELYSKGGFLRFYAGLSFAIVQGPVSKFGAVAANEFAKIMFPTDQFIATAAGSILSGLWRVILMPIDTCKTVLQVGGTLGFRNMMSKVYKGEMSLLYEGTTATLLSSIISHYPWFFVHNLLDSNLFIPSSYFQIVLRGACIGFIASLVSDCISNVLKVIKTVKQSTSTESFDVLKEEKYSKSKRMSYIAVIRKIIEEGGYRALFGRGLSTRLLANAVQSVLFTVIWKLLASNNN
jgi:hypothetical protein